MDDDLMYNDESGDDEEDLGRELLHAVGNLLVKKALSAGGVVILVALAIIILVLSVILLFMGPALALGETSQNLYESIFGELPEDENGEVDISASEAFWYDPMNVLTYIDDFWTMMSTTNDGLAYITKDNFRMILEKVGQYSDTVRSVDNSYKYYHHLYKQEVKNVYTVPTPTEGDEDGSGAVEALGVTNDASTELDKQQGSYVGDDGVSHDIYYTYKITDVETTDATSITNNRSPEDDPKFKVSWEEIYTMAAMKSIVGDVEQDNWETTVSLNGVRPSIIADVRLDEATVNSIINSFQFSVGYYFDPTSNDTMPGSSDTYADHVYSYEEMENYAYVKSVEGTNVEHGTEVAFTTPNFDYYEYKKPAIAPAYAVNAYTTIEYDYVENGDGTATLAGRQITLDGQKFYNYVSGVLGEDFDMEWFVNFVSMLPGSNYDDGNGSLRTRFEQLLHSYEDGVLYSYYDTDFDGVGSVTLGTNCSRTDVHYTTRVDGEGNPVVPPPVDLNITVNDISDEQIRADIAAGLYTLEDLVYTAACIRAEAGSVDGQVAVAWCLRNRVESGKYASYVAAVTAPGQFASPWSNYLDGSYGAQAQSVAAGVLKGEIANPIGDCYFFFGAFSVWGYKPGTYHINVGGNMFYVNWGDVTQVVGREGYVPF